MPRPALKTALTWCVAATLLLPMLLAAVVGLGGLLAAVGDTAAAGVCRGVALAVGVVWLVVIVATTATTALALLDVGPPPRLDGRRRRRGERLDRERPPEPGERLI